jgi:prepilin signal peptidase PulO-like enzyme (type II secretory pathway)
MIIFIVGCLVSSVFDIKKKIIPNFIIYPAFILGILENIFIWHLYMSIVYSIIQGVLFAFFAFNKIFGFGDAKLGFLLGGIQTNFFMLLISILLELFLSGIFALCFIKKSEKVPIAPILFIGALLTRLLI